MFKFKESCRNTALFEFGGTMENIYLPDIVGGGYGEFWNDKSRYRVLKGGKGSKKSTTTALNFICRLMKYPESNLLVVRAVFNTHKDSTFAQLRWAQEKLGVSHLWRNTMSPLEMTYIPTGQKILFKGFDDWQKLASTTVPKGYLNFVWCEECYEILSEEEFEKLDFSMPRSKVSEPLFNQTTLTFNPWLDSHWLKRRFFDTPSPLVSTYSTNYLCNEHLTPEYITSMEELRERNYRRYAVIGLGEWGIAEGLVFENWEVLEFDFDESGAPCACNNGTGNPSPTDDNPVEETDCRATLAMTRSGADIENTYQKGNVRHPESLGWQWRRFFGLDYGYTNDPTAFIAFAANPITKELFIYDEHYETKMLNSDIADMIKRKGYAKERIRADAAEPKSNDDLRRLGISRIQPSVKGRDSVINGIAQLQEYKIYVNPRCVNTIHELGSYVWKKDKDDRGLNVPEDRDNHLMDSLRYAFYDVRFFRPQDPAERHRLTADERYSRYNSVTAEDINGGWG